MEIINKKDFNLCACISEGKTITAGWRSYKKVLIPVLFLDITSHILRREHGSTPVDGSSRITTLDPPMRAMDMDNFLFIPPDSVPTLLWRWLYSPVSFKVLQKWWTVVMFYRQNIWILEKYKKHPKQEAFIEQLLCAQQGKLLTIHDIVFCCLSTSWRYKINTKKTP